MPEETSRCRTLSDFLIWPYGSGATVVIASCLVDFGWSCFNECFWGWTNNGIASNFRESELCLRILVALQDINRHNCILSVFRAIHVKYWYYLCRNGNSDTNTNCIHIFNKFVLWLPMYKSALFPIWCIIGHYLMFTHNCHIKTTKLSDCLLQSKLLPE